MTCVGPSTTRTELLNLQLSTSLDVISDTASKLVLVMQSVFMTD